MTWLANHLWILPVLGFVPGLAAGWWIWHPRPRPEDPDFEKELASLRCRIEESEAQKTILRAKVLELEGASRDAAPDSEPETVDSLPLFAANPEEGEPDDLKQIVGIGPQLEALLHDLGIYYFHQIASWTDSQVAAVEAKMPFKGRIMRDNWRGQAGPLAAQRQNHSPMH